MILNATEAVYRCLLFFWVVKMECVQNVSFQRQNSIFAISNLHALCSKFFDSVLSSKPKVRRERTLSFISHVSLFFFGGIARNSSQFWEKCMRSHITIYSLERARMIKEYHEVHQITWKVVKRYITHAQGFVWKMSTFHEVEHHSRWEVVGHSCTLLVVGGRHSWRRGKKYTKKAAFFRFSRTSLLHYNGTRTGI